MYILSDIFGVNQGVSRYPLSPTLRKPSDNLGIIRKDFRVCAARPASKTSEWRRETRLMAVDRDSSNGPDEGGPLKRSELIELLQQAVDTLLLPENLERLRELTQSEQGKRTAAQTAEIDSGKRALDQTEAVDTSKRVDALVSEGLGKDRLEVGQSKPSPASNVGSVKDMGDNSSKSVVDTRNILSESVVDTRNILSESVVDTREIPSESVDDLNENALTDIRQLKVLNVHSYVHNALRHSAMRSWLQDREIEE